MFKILYSGEPTWKEEDCPLLMTEEFRQTHLAEQSLTSTDL